MIWRFGLWIYVLCILILPLASVLLGVASFWGKGLGFDQVYLSSFRNSLFIGVATTALASLWGGIASLLLAKTNLSGRYYWLLLLTLPLFFLPYHQALAYTALLPGKSSFLLFSLGGVVFVLAGSFYPIVLWLGLIAFWSLPPEEEEAALLASGPKKAFWKIILPQVLPYYLAGALLVFLFAFSELGVPTFLGVGTLPKEILLRFAAFYDFQAAIIAAIPLLVLGVILFLSESFLLRRRLSFPQTQSLVRGLVFDLGPWKGPALCFLVCLVFAYVLLPLGALLKETLSFAAFPSVLRGSLKSLLVSIFYALVVAYLASLFALLSTYWPKRWERKWFSLASLLDFVFPPVIIALGVIHFWGKFAFLQGTPALIILGLLARFTFLPYKSLESAREQMDPSILEAALFSPASRFQVLRRLIYPLFRRWFYLGLMLAFVFSMNELGISTLLYPPGGEPLTVRLYTLSVNNPVGVSSTLALLNSLTTLVFVAFFFRKISKESL